MSVTGEPGWRTGEGGSRASRRGHRAVRRDRDTRGAARASGDRPRPAREHVALRRERGRDGESGGEPPHRRAGAWSARQRPPEHRALPGVPSSDRPFILAGGNDRLFRRTCEVVGPASSPTTSDSRRTSTRGNRDALIPLLWRSSRRGRRPSGSSSSTRPGSRARRSARWTRCSPLPRALLWWRSVEDPGRGGELRLVASPIRFDGRRLPMRLAPPTLGADNATVLDP